MSARFQKRDPTPPARSVDMVGRRVRIVRGRNAGAFGRVKTRFQNTPRVLVELEAMGRDGWRLDTVLIEDLEAALSAPAPQGRLL